MPVLGSSLESDESSLTSSMSAVVPVVIRWTSFTRTYYYFVLVGCSKFHS